MANSTVACQETDLYTPGAESPAVRPARCPELSAEVNLAAVMFCDENKIEMRKNKVVEDENDFFKWFDDRSNLIPAITSAAASSEDSLMNNRKVIKNKQSMGAQKNDDQDKQSLCA